MTTTILRTVPCSVCGHRIGPDVRQCPYCGESPGRKRRPIRSRTRTAYAAHLAGRCASCGGRMARDRSIVARVLAKFGWRPQVLQRSRLICTSCGHLETRA